MMKGGHSEEGGEVPMKVPMGAGECRNREGRTRGARPLRPIWKINGNLMHHESCGGAVDSELPAAL